MKIFLYIVAAACFFAGLCGLLISSYGMMVIFFALGGYLVYGAKNASKHRMAGKAAPKPAPVQKMESRKEPGSQGSTSQKGKSSGGVKNIKIDGKCITADVGKTGDIDCDIICKSENGMYFFGSGTYCANEDADLIDCIFLFTKNKMIYRKEFESYVESALLFDDGSVVMYDDEEILRVYDAEGKQVVKKSIGLATDLVDMNSERALFYGTDDDGCQQLAMFMYADKKLIVNTVPDLDIIDEEGEEDTIFGSDAVLHIVPGGFIIVYPNDDYIFIDAEGNKKLLPKEMDSELMKLIHK